MWTTKHLSLDGDYIDRDMAFPDIELILVPQGVETNSPVHVLDIQRVGAKSPITRLSTRSLKELRDWLNAEALVE